jgi:transcriptional regulator with XRE-family HTH domain
MKQDDWPARLTHGIGRRVAAARREQHLSAAALAQRCAGLGVPTLTRQVIAFIENGRRESVSVAELLVLAAALEVPPMELLFPLGDETATEILPGREIEPWYAARWAAGADKLWLDKDTTTALDAQAMGQATAWIFFSRHDQLVTRALDGSWAERDVARGDLRYLRRAMREHGYQPPPLPHSLAHLDNVERGD